MNDPMTDPHKRVPDAVLREAGRLFAGDEASFVPLPSYESAVYSVAGEDSRGRIALKLTEAKRRSEADIRGELDFVRYAGENGVLAARPIRSRNGKLAEEILPPEGEEEAGVYLAYAFEWAEGEEPSVESEELHRLWGETVGRLHRISLAYVPTRPEWERARWDADADFLAVPKLLASDPQLEAAARGCLQRLSALPEHRDSFGPVHHDLHPGNMRLSGGKLTIFDFDGLVRHHFASDIAVCQYAVVSQLKPTADRAEAAASIQRRFLGGYASQRPVPGDYARHLTDWLTLRHLMLYASLRQRCSGSRATTTQRWTLNRYRVDLLEGKLFGIDLDRFANEFARGRNY